MSVNARTLLVNRGSVGSSIGATRKNKKAAMNECRVLQCGSFGVRLPCSVSYPQVTSTMEHVSTFALPPKLDFDKTSRQEPQP